MGKTLIILYSATGGSSHVAKHLPHDEIITVWDILKDGYADWENVERLGFVFPTYYGGVPYPMVKCIKEFYAKQDNTRIAYIFAVATCGGAPVFAFTELERLLIKSQSALTYTASVCCPDCYLGLKSTISSEKAAAIFASADNTCQRISEDIESDTLRLPTRHPFRRMAGMIIRIMNMPGKKKISVDDQTCTRCSACVNSCPMGNIKLEDGHVVHGNECILCGACFHLCPQDATHYKNKKGRYHNPDGDYKGNYSNV